MRVHLTTFLLLICISSFAQQNVLTQHNDLNRSGWNRNETRLNHNLLRSGKFGCVGTLAVDDEIYAQLLVAENVTIGKFTGSVLIAATVNNSVYAFDAKYSYKAIPLWQVNLSPAGQRAPNIFDLQDNVYGAPCGGNYRDFSGRMGIVGTPVIDTATGTIYVATKTIDANGKFYAYINALDIKTGQHRTGSPQLIRAQVVGTGDGSINGVLRFDAKYSNQRPALLLYQNTVYVATASHCDWGPYHGWIMGFDASTLALKYRYNTTPNGWAGGIWMAGQGPSVGADGNIYIVTGNGTTSESNTNFKGGRSESLIKLSPSLVLLDWFTPSNYAYLDQYDLDYGCDGALIVPNTSLTVSGSKEGISYVVDYNKMGRYNATNSQVKDTLEFNPNRGGYVHIHGSPVYAGLKNGEFVYAWAETFKIRQFAFNRTTGLFANTFKEGVRNLDNGMPGAMLSISSNGNDTASAVVWACFPSSGNANNQVRPGTLAAYNAADVSKGELWNSGLNPQDDVGNFAKFNSPTVVNAKVYVPTFSKVIKVYGPYCGNALTNLQYGNGNGLKAEYFSASSASAPFTNPNSVQLDGTVNFNWGQDAPADGISKDVFKVRWTGTLLPLTNDTYTIYVNASDGVRLYINNVLLINKWTDKTATTNAFNIALQKSVQYDIRLEYYSNTNPAYCNLQWSAPGICRQIIPTPQLVASTAKCSSNGTGLLAEYFSNTLPAASFPAVATVTTTVPVVNFDWGNGSPTGISNDLFKARFTGYVQSLDSGTYTFYVTSDDGIRLWVNNQLLVDQWIDQGATEYSGSITLAQCSKVSIRMEYYENGGDAVCKLLWKGPTFSKQVVPVNQLFLQPKRMSLQAEITKSLPSEIKIYPNPVSGSNVTIVTGLPFQAGTQLLIYNTAGKLVESKSVSQISGLKTLGNTIQLSVHLPSGFYVLKVVNGNSINTAKLVVL